MGGDPIPGEHWVEVDLQGLYHINKLMIDWEVAFSADYSVKVCVAPISISYSDASTSSGRYRYGNIATSCL